jgi:hypothetical protein
LLSGRSRIAFIGPAIRSQNTNAVHYELSTSKIRAKKQLGFGRAKNPGTSTAQLDGLSILHRNAGKMVRGGVSSVLRWKGNTMDRALSMGPFSRAEADIFLPAK